MKTLLLAALLLVSIPAFADDYIDIQGFHTGMDNSAFNHQMLHVRRHVTLGGVELKAPFSNHGCKNQAGCSLFGTGTVDWFQFNFDAGQFGPVRAAVVAQYPATVCTGDTCTYETAAEKLTLTAGNIEVSIK